MAADARAQGKWEVWWIGTGLPGGLALVTL